MYSSFSGSHPVPGRKSSISAAAARIQAGISGELAQGKEAFSALMKKRQPTGFQVRACSYIIQIVWASCTFRSRRMSMMDLERGSEGGGSLEKSVEGMSYSTEIGKVEGRSGGMASYTNEVIVDFGV